MRGFYRIYEDGVLVGEQENIITTAGRRIIADYLAGLVAQWAGAIAIGAGATTPAVADARLDFEYYRNAVESKTVSYGLGTGGTHVITVKSSIDNATAGTIVEVGLYPTQFNDKAASGGGYVISQGDSTEPWYVYSGGDWVANTNVPDTANALIGTDGVVLDTGNHRLAGVSYDFSAYSGQDQFQTAMQILSGTPSGIEIRFNTDDSNYFSYTPTLSALVSGTSYTVSSLNKSAWTATGSPDWSNITSIEFQISGTCTVLMDGIRVSDADTVNPSYALVSRAVLTTPIIKNNGSLMEIEYYVEI